MGRRRPLRPTSMSHVLRPRDSGLLAALLGCHRRGTVAHAFRDVQGPVRRAVALRPLRPPPGGDGLQGGRLPLASLGGGWPEGRGVGAELRVVSTDGCAADAEEGRDVARQARYVCERHPLGANSVWGEGMHFTGLPRKLVTVIVPSRWLVLELVALATCSLCSMLLNVRSAPLGARQPAPGLVGSLPIPPPPV